MGGWGTDEIGVLAGQWKPTEAAEMLQVSWRTCAISEFDGWPSPMPRGSIWDILRFSVFDCYLWVCDMFSLCSITLHPEHRCGADRLVMNSEV